MLMRRKSQIISRSQTFFAVTAEVKSLLRSCVGVVVLHYTQFIVLVIAALPTVSTLCFPSMFVCYKYVRDLT